MVFDSDSMEMAKKIVRQMNASRTERNGNVYLGKAYREGRMDSMIQPQIDAAMVAIEMERVRVSRGL